MTLNNAVQPIAAGVLPCLHWLAIDWPRSLADLALPASLSKLELRYLPDLPIPSTCLPPHLYTLCIYTVALHSHQLAGVLPSSLRVLRLHCHHPMPLTAELLEQVPQLEELDLGGYYQHSLTGVLAPLNRLRVLRVGGLARQPSVAGALPLSLRRLTMVTATMEEADALVPRAVRHARLVVDFDSVRFSLGPKQTATEIFSESRRMTAQTMQHSGEERESGEQHQHQHQWQHDHWLAADMTVDSSIHSERSQRSSYSEGNHGHWRVYEEQTEARLEAEAVDGMQEGQSAHDPI